MLFAVHQASLIVQHVVSVLPIVSFNPLLLTGGTTRGIAVGITLVAAVNAARGRLGGWLYRVAS